VIQTLNIFTMIKVTVSDTNLKSFTKIRVTFSELTLNHLYYSSQMSTSYDGIEDLLKTQDRLQKNLDTLLAATSEACLRIEVPQSQQSDNSFEQLSHDSTTQSLNTSGKDVTVCNKCHHNGHLAASCRSSWTKEGKYIGEGEPPANCYWTTRHAANSNSQLRSILGTLKWTSKGLLKQQKRKIEDHSCLTLAEPLFPSILEALDNSDISEFSDA